MPTGVTAVSFVWTSCITWKEQRKSCVLRADTMIFLRYATGHISDIEGQKKAEKSREKPPVDQTRGVKGRNVFI